MEILVPLNIVTDSIRQVPILPGEMPERQYKAIKSFSKEDMERYLRRMLQTHTIQIVEKVSENIGTLTQQEEPEETEARILPDKEYKNYIGVNIGAEYGLGIGSALAFLASFIAMIIGAITTTLLGTTAPVWGLLTLISFVSFGFASLIILLLNTKAAVREVQERAVLKFKKAVKDSKINAYTK